MCIASKILPWDGQFICCSAWLTRCILHNFEYANKNKYMLICLQTICLFNYFSGPSYFSTSLKFLTPTPPKASHLGSGQVMEKDVQLRILLCHLQVSLVICLELLLKKSNIFQKRQGIYPQTVLLCYPLATRFMKASFNIL